MEETVVSSSQTIKEEVVGNAVFRERPGSLYEDTRTETYGEDGKLVQDFSIPVQKNPQGDGPIKADYFNDEGDWHATVIGLTPNGKRVQVMKDPASSFYTIAFAPGGEMPVELKGKFTSYDRAEQHARVWLSAQYGKAASAAAKS